MCGLCGSVNQFLTLHSSDQCKVCLPFDVMRSPRPFLTILEYCKQSKSEAGNQAVQLVCFLPSLLPRLCCWPLPQTPTVVPIPVTSSYSWSIWTLYCLDSQPDQDLDQQRYSAGSSAKICAPWVCRMFVYSGVQEWLFHHQEESK